MKKILKYAVIYGAVPLGLYGAGYFLGVSLHDFIKDLPKYFLTSNSNQWFDPTSYEKMYEVSSYGLRELFGKVFGITSSGLYYAATIK